MRIHHIAVHILLAIFLTGCAFGRHVDYRGSSTFATPPTKIAALGAQDLRPYVTNGSQPPDFVGVMRTTAGKPFDVHSSSGDPLADEMGSLVAGAFKTNGTNIVQVMIPANTSESARNALFKAAHAPYYYLIELREWQTDTPVNASYLMYDVSLSVIDAESGATLATRSASGKDELGSRPDRENLSVSISNIFGDLINDSTIVAVSVDAESAANQPITASSSSAPAFTVIEPAATTTDSTTATEPTPTAVAEPAAAPGLLQKTIWGSNYRENKIKGIGK